MDFKARRHLRDGAARIVNHEYKCLILLCLFLAWFVTAPLWWSDERPSGFDVLLYLGFLVAAPYVITGSRKLFYVSLGMGSCAILIRFFFTGDDMGSYRFLCYSMVLLFFDFSMTGSLVVYTALAKKYTRDLIFGSVFTYFMLGIIFGDAYHILQSYNLVSFNPGGRISWEDCTYYSFATLTTAGYGDIVPANNLSKRLSNFESCVGVLYVAIFIGRLLSTYSAERKE